MLDTIELDPIINSDIGSLTWIPVVAFSNNWTSKAEVALINGGSCVIMRGSFTSNVDSNNDPMGVFPSGYRGVFSVAANGNFSSTLRWLDIGTGGTVLGTTPTANEGDFIYVNFSYDVYPDELMDGEDVTKHPMYSKFGHLIQ